MALVAGCRRVPPPPYRLAFTAEAAPARVVQTSRETVVPITLTNTGQDAWDPARVHLSYHWLWLVPRELKARSRWDVPYHNGIRTDLPGAMAPGARVTVEGRLLPPAWPGLYWLQWDMVEEGVTWFAQVSPRQTRSLVLVIPPLGSIAAPIPFLVALLGLSAVGRVLGSRRHARAHFASVADAVWCAAALAAKPLIVIDAALLEPTAVAYWLIAVCAAVPPVLGLLLLPRRIRAWVLVSIGVFGSLIVLGDILYYRFFGDVLSAPAILAARQTTHVWGSIRSLSSPILWWVVIDCPLAIWLAARVSALDAPAPPLRHRAATAAMAAVALTVAGLALSPRRVLAATALDQMFRDRAVVEQLGLFGFHTYDGWNYARSTWLRAPATDADLSDALSWLESRAPMRAGPISPAFGAARDRNLIVVQVESLQDFVVDFRIGDQEVMPHLKRWTDDSLRFTNLTDQTSEGRTSDAEFTTMTSLLPLDHGAVAFRYPGNHYTALPRVLADRGYHTLSAVAFEPGFWNRQVMHPAYGFQRSLFEPDFTMTEQIGWGLNDRDFLQQMVPRLEALPKPFAAWLITLSLHHPFEDFPGKHKSLRLGALEGSSFGNYLHTMRFFDDALDAFRTSLARDGLLDTSVVVVFGDHDAGFAREAKLAREMGIEDSAAAWTLNDRVPLFVRVPGAANGGNDALRGPRSVAAGQTDLAPTLLGLLGVDAAALPFVGRNLLGLAGDGPVVRPYGEWLDAKHLFVPRGGGAECRDGHGRMVARSDCDRANEVARRARDVSRLIITTDLQEKLRMLLVPARREGLQR